jgi:hypothetical protein
MSTLRETGTSGVWATLWRRVLLRSNRTPRTWVRRWVFDGQFNPKPVWRWLEPNAPDPVRQALAHWLARARQNPSLSDTNRWLADRHRLLATPRMVDVLTVVCTPQTHFVALMLAHHLGQLGFHVRVQTGQPEGTSDAWVLVGAQGMFNLPPRDKRVVFQMEQSVSSRWFNQDYLNILCNSLMVWDYAPTNLAYLAHVGVPAALLHHVPVSPVPGCVLPSTQTPWPARTWDVLFYGDIKVPRRRRFLDALAREFKLQVATHLYGDGLQQTLRDARVVVNIHYYENALLETTRLCECLSHGARVISEAAADASTQALFSPHITFTPVGDVASMMTAVRQALATPPDAQPSTAPLESATARQLSAAVLALGWTPHLA